MLLENIFEEACRIAMVNGMKAGFEDPSNT